MKIDLVRTQKNLVVKLNDFIKSSKHLGGLARDRKLAQNLLHEIEQNKFGNNTDLISYIKENMKCDLGLQLILAKVLVEAELGEDYLQKLQPKPTQQSFFQKAINIFAGKSEEELILNFYENLLRTVSDDNVMELKENTGLN